MQFTDSESPATSQRRVSRRLKNLFLSKHGLFPSQREISFNCDCPDWAIMCKHVAAVLYGIGAKLDENPFLFFELRGIDVNKLVDVTIKDHVDSLLKHADMPVTDRVMDDSCIETLFGLKVNTQKVIRSNNLMAST